MQIIFSRHKFFDIDAQTYFDAAGIIDEIEKNAENTAIIALKDTTIWNKLDGLHFISPTNLATASVNAKNPGTFDLIPVNTPSHSINGVDFNGSTQYFRTGWTPNTHNPGGIHMAFYSRQDVSNNAFVMGCQSATGKATIQPRNGTTVAIGVNSNNTISLSGANPDSLGFFIATREGETDLKFYKNGAILSTGSAGSSINSTWELYLACRNNIGTADRFDTRQIAFYSFGDELTAEEVATYNTIVQTFEKNVISGGRDV